MNNLIEMYDAFRVNRYQVMDLDLWFKIHTNVFNFEYDFSGQCLSVNNDFLNHSGNINLQKGSKISKMPSD